MPHFGDMNLSHEELFHTYVSFLWNQLDFTIDSAGI